jgi:hypothetical protein
MPNAICPKCRYALVNSMCPICEGRQPGDRLTAPVLPLSLSGLRVSREMFVTPQHWEAWKQGKPLRWHLERRKKFTSEDRDIFFRHHPRVCSFCPCTAMLELDHIVPQILGGSSNDVNLRPACKRCNVAGWKPYDA